FEITTRDGRVIVADDPGETVVVDPAGSVTRIPNSSSRMAELQQDQQNALSTLSLGLGQQGAAPGGSSTPTFNAPLQLQPINFSRPQNAATPDHATSSQQAKMRRHTQSARTRGATSHCPREGRQTGCAGASGRLYLAKTGRSCAHGGAVIACGSTSQCREPERKSGPHCGSGLADYSKYRGHRRWRGGRRHHGGCQCKCGATGRPERGQ